MNRSAHLTVLCRYINDSTLNGFTRATFPNLCEIVFQLQEKDDPTTMAAFNRSNRAKVDARVKAIVTEFISKQFTAKAQYELAWQDAELTCLGVADPDAALHDAREYHDVIKKEREAKEAEEKLQATVEQLSCLCRQ